MSSDEEPIYDYGSEQDDDDICSDTEIEDSYDDGLELIRKIPRKGMSLTLTSSEMINSIRKAIDLFTQVVELTELKLFKPNNVKWFCFKYMFSRSIIKY